MGLAALEAGRDLCSFVEELVRSWQGGPDVAVWLHWGDECRLVAVLRNSPRGSPLVTWL
jgi:hypothetical protein